MAKKIEESISKRGILCYRCFKRGQAVKMYVVNTIPFDNGYVRYRKCRVCKATKKTVET